MLQVSGSALQQVEKFKYLGVAFTSDGRWSEEIDTWIGKANPCDIFGTFRRPGHCAYHAALVPPLV